MLVSHNRQRLLTSLHLRGVVGVGAWMMQGSIFSGGQKGVARVYNPSFPYSSSSPSVTLNESYNLNEWCCYCRCFLRNYFTSICYRMGNFMLFQKCSHIRSSFADVHQLHVNRSSFSGRKKVTMKDRSDRLPNLLLCFSQ